MMDRKYSINYGYRLFEMTTLVIISNVVSVFISNRQFCNRSDNFFVDCGLSDLELE